MPCITLCKSVSDIPQLQIVKDKKEDFYNISPIIYLVSAPLKTEHATLRNRGFFPIQTLEDPNLAAMTDQVHKLLEKKIKKESNNLKGLRPLYTEQGMFWAKADCFTIGKDWTTGNLLNPTTVEGGEYCFVIKINRLYPIPHDDYQACMFARIASFKYRVLPSTKSTMEIDDDLSITTNTLTKDTRSSYADTRFSYASDKFILALTCIHGLI